MAESEELEFRRLGVQYYVAARYAAHAGLLPVCGNLYHHALEMFLKAGLSRRRSLEELRSKDFGHKLVNLWVAFKADFPSTALSQYDTTITDVGEFEEIRYPDKVLKNGAAMCVDYRGSAPLPASVPSLRPEKEYKFYYDDVDRLIGEIFVASSQDPKRVTSMLYKRDIREMLALGNPIAKQLLD